MDYSETVVPPEFDDEISLPQLVSEKLKVLYKDTIQPLEKAYNYHLFMDDPLTEAEFDAKPLILGKSYFCSFTPGH